MSETIIPLLEVALEKLSMAVAISTSAVAKDIGPNIIGSDPPQILVVMNLKIQVIREISSHRVRESQLYPQK